MSGKPRIAAARVPEPSQPALDRFRSQHLAVTKQSVVTDVGRARVTVDEAESPLTWLARRRGRDGRPLIEPHQLQAGERLRIEFTRANLMPRTTSNWASPVSSGRKTGYGAVSGTEMTIATRQRVRRALDAAGPEFAGLLVDVCCFLKRLEDVERERTWPARSAKIVLQLALDRLARHYGYAREARGRAHAPVRTWLAEGAEFGVE